MDLAEIVACSNLNRTKRKKRWIQYMLYVTMIS
jgi:hypothetical protein